MFGREHANSLGAEIYLMEAFVLLDKILTQREQEERVRFRSQGLYLKFREVFAPKYPEWLVWEAKALEAINPVKG
jgi:hypothetical protein